MKQIEEEYFKADNTEKNKEQTSQNKSDIVPPSAAGQPSEEMKQWQEAAVRQQVHEQGVPITFSTPFFRKARQSTERENSISPPWTCANCRYQNLAIHDKCVECNMEHPDLANSPYWQCPSCDSIINKSIIKCPKCHPEENP